MAQTAIHEKAPETPVEQPEKPQFPYNVIDPVRENRIERFLEAFAAILEFTNYKPVLDQYARSSMKCSSCTTNCPVYTATGDPKDMPCYRSGILLKIYRRHFTIGGWLRAKVTGDPGLAEEDIDELANLLYRCTACKRCTIECPLGIDHGLMTHLGRWILGELRIVPKGLEIATIEQLHGDSGNTSAILPHALVDTLDFLEEEIEEILGIKMKYPVDQEGREFVFFPAVSDYLMEPETLMGNIAVIHAAGDADNWTIGTGDFDGINYGLFYSDHVLERVIRKMVNEVDRLKGKRILIGECGHASRSAKEFVPVFGGDKIKPVVNFMEYTYEKLMEGKLDLDPDVITDRVTYHDPCNIARSEWIVEQPRVIIRAFIKDFVEMEPHGKNNYCCGGGGGTVSVDELHEFRMSIAGKRKAEQMKATGAKYVIAPCANCKKQLKELVEYYELDQEVVGLHDLILKAIRIPGATPPADRDISNGA
jgi:Fe-S oxidoreductase